MPYAEGNVAGADRRLIVNADDLGLCNCVNRGIERAYREGILTSASLMANTPGFFGGVRVARDNPGLGVGVHLNLLRGRPLSPPSEVSCLLGRDGTFKLNFYSLGGRAPDLLAAARREYCAQVERVLAAGIRPTHLDTEKHHGIWGRLGRLAAEVARHYGIPAMRCLREPVCFALRNLPWPGRGRAWRAALLRACCTLCRHPGPRRGVARPDRLLGQTHIGVMGLEAWRALIPRLPAGVSEVMLHPGEFDADEYKRLAPEIGASWINPCRERELAALLAPELPDLLARHQVQRIHFGHLAPGQTETI